MHRHNRLFVLMVALALLVMALPAGAQGEMGAPSVEVVDQVVLDGTVTIASAYSEGPGWLVIHADGGGAPGPVIGYRALNAGATQNLQV